MPRFIRAADGGTLVASGQKFVVSSHDVRAVKLNTRLPRALGVMTRLAFAHARASGIATAPLLERAGLSRRQIDDPKVRIRVRNQIEFMNLVGAAADDDLLGFHLAHRCELRAVGLYYYVLASSDSLRDVCQRGARFSGMVSEGVAQQFIDGRQIGIRTQFVGVTRFHDRHQMEFWTATVVRKLQELTGTRLIPHRVCFAHPRKRGAREMTSYFGCEVEFGCADDKVLFARSAGELPVLNADPYLNSDVLGEIRRELASRYLKDESLSMSQIAWLLGFQDLGAFSHAFKRWHGTAPRNAAVRVR